MDSVERVYPKEEELSTVNPSVTCPECLATFKSESNLTLHLAKTHKQTHLLQPSGGAKLYHCPITTCSYHEKSQFKQLKLLKQHYLKVHSRKDFICSGCSKGFPTEAFRNSHAEYCNIVFKCCDCEMSYSCYDTLKTHCRRKKHKILLKIAYKTDNPNLQNTSQKAVQSGSNRLILPKPPNLELCQSTQTEIWTPQKTSQQTQTTTRGRKPQLTVETQTIGDYYGRKSEKGAINKSANTQTLAVSPKTVSCNTSFSLDDFDSMMNEVQRSSSSTQTTLYNPEIDSSVTSIHTDTSDLLTATFDSNFFNMETQTDFMFDDEIFECCDYYSNMYTQTCTDLLGEMEFSNIHTQTGFGDVLKSVESQTVMSKRTVMGCKDMSHMETQTDLEFKQMLEEINA